MDIFHVVWRTCQKIPQAARKVLTGPPARYALWKPKLLISFSHRDERRKRPEVYLAGAKAKGLGGMVARQLKLVTVVVSPCAVRDHDRLQHFQMLPRDAHPISTFSPRDKGWASVAEGVVKVCKDLISQRKTGH